MSLWKWQEEDRIQWGILWCVSFYEVMTGEDQRRWRNCWNKCKSVIYCLCIILFTYFKYLLKCLSQKNILSHVCLSKNPLTFLLHQNTLSDLCISKTFSHKTSSSKTSHGTTESPNKSDIYPQHTVHIVLRFRYEDILFFICSQFLLLRGSNNKAWHAAGHMELSSHS